MLVYDLITASRNICECFSERRPRVIVNENKFKQNKTNKILFNRIVAKPRSESDELIH